MNRGKELTHMCEDRALLMGREKYKLNKTELRDMVLPPPQGAEVSGQRHPSQDRGQRRRSTSDQSREFAELETSAAVSLSLLSYEGKKQILPQEHNSVVTD